MLFLQRISSVKYQILETYSNTNCRIVDRFNDDRGLKPQALIRETISDHENVSEATVRCAQIMQCQVLR